MVRFCLLGGKDTECFDLRPAISFFLTPLSLVSSFKIRYTLTTPNFTFSRHRGMVFATILYMNERKTCVIE